MTLKSVARGNIQITNKTDKTFQFKEVIHIAVLLKSNLSKFKVKQWQDEILRHSPLSTKYEEFSISKREWFTKATIFVVPTITFGETKIEINLEEHALFGTGFTIELFLRTKTTRKLIKTTNKVITSLGGTIETVIQWPLNNSEYVPTIKYKPKIDQINIMKV